MSSAAPASPDDWDSHWQHYAESAIQNPAQRMRHDLIARLLPEAAPTDTPRILDLGSGQGDLLLKLSRLFPDAKLVGAELSEEGVAISRRKVPSASFIVADLFRPPESLTQYEEWATHAVCSEVLEHVDDPISFLEHSRRYLACDGKLIVTVPGGPISAFDLHIGHRQHFNRQELGRILERAGYRVERIYATGFPFFNVYRLFVVAGGKSLTRDVGARSSGATSTVARHLMKVFHVLFQANLRDSRFGWQLIAVARKPLP